MLGKKMPPSKHDFENLFKTSSYFYVNVFRHEVARSAFCLNQIVCFCVKFNYPDLFNLAESCKELLTHELWEELKEKSKEILVECTVITHEFDNFIPEMN